MNIKLTVIIPCFNFENYITTSVDSVLSQITNFNYEILIIDDCSTDNSYKIIKEKYSNRPNIHIFQSPKNCGITLNLKKIFRNAVGSYIFLLDGDDYLTDDHYLQRAIDFLDSNQKYVMYCSGYKTLYPDGSVVPSEDHSFFVGLKDTVTHEDLCSKNYITFARIFRNYRNYVKSWMDDSLHEDWAINAEILKYGLAKCEKDKCVGIYRITNTGRITSLKSDQVIEKNLKTMDLIVKNKNVTDRVIVHIHLFLNTLELEKMAYENLKKIKDSGFNILITSPKPLPLYFYDVVDIFYHDKENQLLKNDYTDVEAMWHWTTTDLGTLSFGVRELQKHGLAVLRSMIKGCQIANLNNYDYIIRCEFDDLFGPVSFLNIKNKMDDVIERNTDFNLIKNTYSYYTDVSVHLMFYKCDKFMDVFSSIIDEETYNDELCNLGIPKKSIMLETFIYLMIEYYRKKINLNINYDDTTVIENNYFDTYFNAHQNCFSLIDGVLSDVAYIFEKNILNTKKICLATRNFSSTLNFDVIFEIKRKNASDPQIIKLNTGGIGSWNIFYLDVDVELDTIFIKNHGGDYHKKYKVIFENNNTQLIELENNEHCISKLEVNII